MPKEQSSKVKLHLPCFDKNTPYKMKYKQTE